MTFTSEATYYLTLLEQMIIYTFFYHHISKPKKSYWFTVGFYFVCISAVHIAFLPFGPNAMNSLFPHIVLLLAEQLCSQTFILGGLCALDGSVFRQGGKL